MTMPSVSPRRVRVTVPHDGAGTHTLLVALPIDDSLLADPAQDRDVVREVARLARSALIRHRARAVLARVCADLGVTEVQLRSRRRDRQLTALRCEAARRMRAVGLSTPAIGAALDRDHTTVLWMLGRARRPADADSTCEVCGVPTVAGSRWCAIGGCPEQETAPRWSWSQQRGIA